MSNLRGISLVAIAGLLCACSRNAASPEQSAATTAATTGPAPTTSAAAKPGDSNNPNYISIQLKCAAGPIPAAPGKSPEVARELTYEDMGPGTPGRPVLTAIWHLSGAADPGKVSLTPVQRERLYRHAIAALGGPAPTPEVAVPDGESCRLQVFRSVIQLDTEVLLPTSNKRFQPLMNELVPLLPAHP